VGARGFGSYRKPVFVQREIAAFDLLRNFSQGFFDLLRNFVLVGGLKYFYEKSDSAVLYYLHQFVLVVTFLYCMSGGQYHRRRCPVSPDPVGRLDDRRGNLPRAQY
jgi:hypothetical protein